MRQEAERVPKSKPMASPSNMTGKVPVMPNDPDQQCQVRFLLADPFPARVVG